MRCSPRSPGPRGSTGADDADLDFEADLARRAFAWQLGGAGAVAVATDPWMPAADDLGEGRDVLERYGSVRIWRNRARLADSGVQLRLGRDGLWYRFVQGSRVWEPDSTGAADPGALVASLVEAGEADEAARETSLSWGVSRATTRFARTS
ncbi:MAG: hypothetical protein IT198_04955 [Acidimicrobiia bacterium]|nr:hypothetical protein [Acidimicrobiia bacterium]